MTSPLVVDLNTFGDLASFQAYIGDSLRGETLDGFEAETQEKALLTGTRLFQRQQWAGQRTGLSTVRSAGVASGGTGYAVGDVLVVAGGAASVPASARVLTAPGGAVATVQLLDAGLYSTLPANSAATTGGGGSGCTLDLVTDGQALAFPRTGVSDVDGVAVDPLTVPEPIRDALFELAFEMLGDPDLETSSGTGSNTKALGAGSAHIEYFRPTDGPGKNQRFPTIVQELIAPYLGGGGAPIAFASGTDVESTFDTEDSFTFSQGLP